MHAIDSDDTPPTTKSITTLVCPCPVIPEVPWGTVMASASMIMTLLVYIDIPRFRRERI